MGLFSGSTELRADGNPRLLRWLCSGGVNTQNLDTQTGEFTRACLPVELLVALGVRQKEADSGWGAYTCIPSPNLQMLA